MNRNNRLIALAITILLSAGFANAEAELTIVDTAVVPASPLSLPEILLMATPAAPPIPKINFDPQREFGRYFRGEKLESALFTSSLVTLTALNVADYLSTREALKLPGLREANPLMKPFVKNAAVFAAVKAGTTGLSVWATNKMFRKGNRTTAWMMTIASNIFLYYVVSNNMRLIQKSRLR